MAIDSSPTKSEVQVCGVIHFLDLIKRGKTDFRLQSPIKPSGKIRSQILYVSHPKEIYGKVDGHVVTDNFAYDVCLRVLEDPEEYPEAKVFCQADWSAHEIAKEEATWQS